MAISGGHSVFSSGPKITQAVPVAQRTPTIPTEYGIPTMAMDSIDPRVSEVPALDAAYEYKGENANSRFPKLEGAEQHREYPQSVKSVKEKEPLRTGSFNDADVAEDGAMEDSYDPNNPGFKRFSHVDQEKTVTESDGRKYKVIVPAYTKQDLRYDNNIKRLNREKSKKPSENANDADVAEDALHPAHSAPSTGSVIERYKNQVENPMPNKPKATAKDDDGDMSMDE